MITIFKHSEKVNILQFAKANNVTLRELADKLFITTKTLKKKLSVADEPYILLLVEVIEIIAEEKAAR